MLGLNVVPNFSNLGLYNSIIAQLNETDPIEFCSRSKIIKIIQN